MSEANYNRPVAIVGVGESKKVGKYPGFGPEELKMEGTQAALEDSGLTFKDIDAVLSSVAVTDQFNMHSVDFGQKLGIKQRYSATLQNGGATNCMMVLEAANAISQGQCETALLISGDSLRSLSGMQSFARMMFRVMQEGKEKRKLGTGMMSGSMDGDMTAMMSRIGHPQFEVPMGPSLISGYAFAAGRHMAKYGTKPEHLAQMAVTIRKHASMNPRAQKQEPLTIDDVLNGKLISWPLHKDECSLISDGGGAIILTSLERAKDLKKKPIVVLGAGGASSDHDSITMMQDLTTTPAVHSGKIAYEKAGVTPKDIDFAELYDCFSITPMLFLEDLGFCKKGEVGPFIEGGTRIEVGGELPVTTHGGCLSYCHPGMPVVFHLTEAVRQLRGEVEGPRKIKDPELAIVHANGGILSNHVTVILGKN